ncbi:MAG: bacteriohemerythrin [Treponema sp.]|nr:bacteriohemerythrin [Treponema sp.]
MNRGNELITWSNKLMCGIRLIDEQHKGLVMLVNEMFNHVTGDEKQESEYFQRVIKEAVKYVKIHFATEEKIMLATKFKGYAEHKKEHDAFIINIFDTIHNFQYRKRFNLYSFTKFLKDWILTHIALTDKQYFTYLRSIATRQTDGRLCVNVKECQRS